MRCKSCNKTNYGPRADNWENHQMCYRCARTNFPLEYETKPDHGTGGSKMNMAPVSGSFVAETIIMQLNVSTTVANRISPNSSSNMAIREGLLEEPVPIQIQDKKPLQIV